MLAATARGRPFNKLSLRRVGAVGAGAGILYWIFLASTGGRSWSPQSAIGNFVLLVVMGTGTAAATLLIARKARAAQKSGDKSHSLGVGVEDIIHDRSSAKVEAPRQ